MSQILLVILVPSSLLLPLGVRNKPERNVKQTKGSDHPRCKLDMLVNLRQMMIKQCWFYTVSQLAFRYIIICIYRRYNNFVCDAIINLLEIHTLHKQSVCKQVFVYLVTKQCTRYCGRKS